MHPGACTGMRSPWKKPPWEASPGSSGFSWSATAALGSTLKHGPPLGVSAGSPRGLFVSAAGREVRAGVHPVPGFSARRGCARLQAREGGPA